MIEIISATRMSENEFWSKAALGISLRRLAHDTRLIPKISFDNKLGLPEIYNARIIDPDGHDMLVFMHDDVWIDDYFLADRLLAGLSEFDVIGVAGVQRRKQRQPAWAFTDDNFTWEAKDNLSGSIAHGSHPFGDVSVFGIVPAECQLLDGVFLAARKSVFQLSNVKFDTQFDFHFYDLDFCRTAQTKGLLLGTWPICLTHQSGGAFGSPIWNEKYRLYQEKWSS